MFKKLSLLGMSFMLALYPTAVLAAEKDSESDKEQPKSERNVANENNAPQESADQDQSDQNKQKNNKDADKTKQKDDKASKANEGDKETETDKNKKDGDDNQKDDNKPTSDKNTDSNKEQSDEAKQNDDQKADNEADSQTKDQETSVKNDKETEEKGNKENKMNTQTEDDQEENEKEEDNGNDDEDLNLKEIHGTANGDIAYDFNKGYYVLHLQAGLSNYTNTQDVNKKWVAFALPNGVAIPDVGDVPSGILPVQLNDGGTGVAVKVPDVKGIGNQTIFLDIPLQGVPEDNDPNNNLYLLNVDGNAGTYEEIGQIKSQRDIDFSVMDDNPQLDLHGSIDGKATFNNEKGYYVLDVTVKAQNQTDSSVDELYAGFEIPEGVRVLNNDNTPANIQPIQLEDGSNAVAVKLPKITSDDKQEVSYQIPIIGVSDEKMEASTINAYKIENNSYHPVGQYEGTISVDFSEMTEQWEFDAKSQIVKDFPGLDNNQFGLNFAFNASNLTIDNIDKVKVEFNVPEDITVHEPDEYTQGNVPDALDDFLSDGGLGGDLDIEWDGNTAIIHLDSIDGAAGYEGFFSAIGESTKALSELEGINVQVTLYQNGNEVVEEIDVPFEIVSYEGDGKDPGDGEDDKDDGNKPGNDEDKDKNDKDDNSNKPGNDSNKPGDEKDPGKDKDDNKDDGNKDKDENNKKDNNKKDNNKTEDDKKKDADKIDSDDEDDSDELTVTETNDSGLDGMTLPDTATNLYTWLLTGGVLTVAGVGLLLFRKKKQTDS